MNGTGHPTSLQPGRGVSTLVEARADQRTTSPSKSPIHHFTNSPIHHFGGGVPDAPSRALALVLRSGGGRGGVTTGRGRRGRIGRRLRVVAAGGDDRDGDDQSAGNVLLHGLLDVDDDGWRVIGF